MYYIYAIYNKIHKKIYIGQTVNIVDRMILHNTRSFKNSFTSRFDGEWQLIYTETVDTRQQALKKEQQIKNYRGDSL